MAKAEHAVPRPVPVDVRHVVTERVAGWQPVASDRGVSLTADVAGHAIAAIGDGQLEQVLDNLLANALDATTAGDHVTVSVTATSGSGPSGSAGATRGRAAPLPVSASDGVRVLVADDGPGMSQHDRARAFGRFTTLSPGGTGLGLAIVYRLVTSNGGTAKLEETPGGGLSVMLEFRAAPPAQAGDPRPSAARSARCPGA